MLLLVRVGSFPACKIMVTTTRPTAKALPTPVSSKWLEQQWKKPKQNKQNENHISHLCERRSWFVRSLREKMFSSPAISRRRLFSAQHSISKGGFSRQKQQHCSGCDLRDQNTQGPTLLWWSFHANLSSYLTSLTQNVFVRGCFWELNKVTCVRHLAQCLANSMPLMNRNHKNGKKKPRQF